MSEELLTGLASILILGIGAQWLAWRFQLPSIVLMLAFGIIAGPATGLIDPDEIFGDLLLPIVSISVAIILFEGGLSLRLSELRSMGSIIPRLITIGAVITWLVTAAAGRIVVGLDQDIAILMGAILVVSGPTVIIPILRQVRPTSQLNSVLKWEGIVIDPIGAILAVIVFQEVLGKRLEDATSQIAIGIGETILVGTLMGAAGAYFILILMRRYWIPDFLQSPMALMMVVAVYAGSDLFREESGLLATTIMGVILGNQKRTSVRHIIEFKENLGILLVSSLFILLAARLHPSDFGDLGWGVPGFLFVLILMVRPLAVILSTIRSSLNMNERIFLMAMAPRGIVAAAVASVFALRLEEAGHPGANQIVPLTFIVIMATVAVYGLSASPLARYLQVSQPNPQGFLIMGAHSWARSIASALKEKGYEVIMVDIEWANLAAARKAGITTFYASILSRYAMDEIDLGRIGHLLALTANTGSNSLAALHFAPNLGRKNVYQLSPGGEESGRKEAVSQHLRGRILFGPDITYSVLTEKFNEGAMVKATSLTEKFDYNDFKGYYGDKAIPLFLINATGNISVFTTDSKLRPEPGQALISLVDPIDE